MNKIWKSAALILAIAAVAGYATYSYFSDTETSTGNTFTAGSLDLRFQTDGVDQAFADVNGAPLFSGVNVFDGDLKPGDEGEKTVKLWVDDNPSCGQVSVNLTEDQDNSCTTPELIDDPTCAASANGELNDAINFAIWADTDCNNVLDAGESMLTSGTITENKAYGIGELPTSEATARCYGIAYCFGTWDGTTCDGSLVNNASQTDSFKADIVIDALQKRNQFEGDCPVGDIKPEPVCLYSVEPTGVTPYAGLYGGTVTPVLITNTDCSTVNALRTDTVQNYAGTGWAGWSCVQPGYLDAIGGGVIGGSAAAQGLAEFGAPAVGGSNYPVYPHYTFNGGSNVAGGEEGWVAQSDPSAIPTGIYVLCAATPQT